LTKWKRRLRRQANVKNVDIVDEESMSAGGEKFESFFQTDY